MLHPSKVGIAGRWHTKLPSHIISQLVGAPIAEVERGISHNIVGFQCGMLIIEEGIGIWLAQVGFHSTNSYIHVRHLPRAAIGFLTINADVAKFHLVVLNKLGALHKHTTTSTAGIINAPLEGFDNLNNRTDDTTWRIEFACILTLHRGKFLQAVFIDST